MSSLWIVPDNGVVTTINTRGYVNEEGTISFNPNFVYGAEGTPPIQPNAINDQSWRYSDDGYRVITGPSTGGFTPNYELINAGPMVSDGSDWGYKPQDATPTFDYFPQTFYPGSSSYSYPGAPIAAGVEKEAYRYTTGNSAYGDYSKVQTPVDEPFTGIA